MREIKITFTMLTDADLESLDNLSFDMAVQTEMLEDLGFKVKNVKTELDEIQKE